jgi:RNA ligase
MEFKMPSIEQFRNIVRNVQHTTQFIGMSDDGQPIIDRMIELPTLTFKGTVKLHGTNASIVFGTKPDDIKFQSKNNVLGEGMDNAGFKHHMKTVLSKDDLLALENDIIESISPEVLVMDSDNLVVYGEWCGESIQKNVAITGLPKMFVIFGIRIKNMEDDFWVDPVLWENVDMPDKQIFNIHKFPTFSLDIDFNKPQLSQNALGEITMQVENECPVGKYFGISGCGEGVVWSWYDKNYCGKDFRFKVKGEKHSVSKVKTLAPVDVEKMKSVDDFMDKVVTENRLNQGIEYLNEMGQEVTEKSTGMFISWVFKDCLKEESDTLEASGLNKKDIGKPLGTLARKWYFNYLNRITNENKIM